MSVICLIFGTVLSFQVFLSLFFLKKNKNCHGKYHVLGIEFAFIVEAKCLDWKWVIALQWQLNVI